MNKCLRCGKKVTKRKDGNIPLWCKSCNADMCKQFNEMINL